MNATIQPLALTIKETAEVLACGETLVRRLVAERIIPHVRLGGDRIVIPVAALGAWLASEAAASVKPEPSQVAS